MSTKVTKEEDIDVCVAEAETLWKNKKYDEAISKYERALTFAKEKKDEVKEGTICLGIGFAMLSLKGRKKKAVAYLDRSREVAEKQGQKGQVEFVSHLIREAGKDLEKEEEMLEMASKAAANAFAKTVGIDPLKNDETCCKDKKNHYSEHVARVIVKAAEDTSTRGMVTAVKSSSTPQSELKSIWSKWFRDEASSKYFVQLLSERLGGFELPSHEKLLSSCPDVGSLALYIQEHCPVQGDCSVCPSKDTCTAHEDTVDIEDCTRESGCVTSTST